MICDAIRYKPIVIQLVKDFPDELKEQFLSQADQIFLWQLYNVLYPFNNFTKLVSERRLTIGTIRSVYLDISKLFTKVQNREGDYNILDIYIVNVFKSQKVKEKFEKYNAYINQCLIYFIVSVLDPRIKGTFIEVDYVDGKAKLDKIRCTIHKLYLAQRPMTLVDATGSPMKSSIYEYQLLCRVHKTSTPMSDID